MNELIETHIGFAHAIAAELAGKYPPNITRADLERAAELGLVQAAQNYDPSRFVSFATFAYYRVRGAIFDEVRTSWNASHLKVHGSAPERFADPSSTEEESFSLDDFDEKAHSGSSGQFVSLESSCAERIPATTESPVTHVLKRE